MAHEWLRASSLEADEEIAGVAVKADCRHFGIASFSARGEMSRRCSPGVDPVSLRDVSLSLSFSCANMESSEVRAMSLLASAYFMQSRRKGSAQRPVMLGAGALGEQLSEVLAHRVAAPGEQNLCSGSACALARCARFSF
mmetsp:Transcript_120184/g.385081  ORF Transcript_120184/g.385081 Transcript_120184/m.385081 type:complete len:140 (-) Transcript_120184:45-464(-)